MKKNYLLPHGFKKAGWIGLIVFGLLMVNEILKFVPLSLSGKMFVLSDFMGKDFFVVETVEFAFSLIAVGLILSLMAVGFSKERDEDECIARIRERMIVWSVIVYGLLSVIATLFVFGLPYITALIVSLFVVWVFFVVGFQIQLCRFRKENGDEK